MVPPRRTSSDRGVECGKPVDAGVLHHRTPHRGGQEAGRGLNRSGDRRTVCLHSHGIDHRVGAPAVGLAADHVFEVALAEVDDVDAVLARSGQPLVDEVDTENPNVMRLAIRHAIEPIGPRPSTSSVPPSGAFAYSTACHAVGSTSDR